MPARKTDDDRLLELVQRLLELGVTPRSLTVGDVELVVHAVDRQDRQQVVPSPGPSSYLERALIEEKSRRISGRTRGEG